MLDKLRQFIAEVASPLTQDNRPFSDTDYRLAATALLIHVVSLDGEPSEVEREELPTVEQLLGRPPRDFTTWAQDHRAALTAAAARVGVGG